MNEREARGQLGKHLRAGLTDARARRLDVALGLEDLLVVRQCQIDAAADGEGEHFAFGGPFREVLVLRQVRADGVHGLLHRRGADEGVHAAGVILRRRPGLDGGRRRPGLGRGSRFLGGKRKGAAEHARDGGESHCHDWSHPHGLCGHPQRRQRCAGRALTNFVYP